MRSSISCCLLLALLALSVVADDCVKTVDPVGGVDGEDCGSAEAACKTIAAAFTAAVAKCEASTVLVISLTPGTYKDPVLNVEVVGHDVRIEGSGEVVWDGETTHGFLVVELAKDSLFTLKGITFQNGVDDASPINIQQAEHVEIDDCQFKTNKGAKGGAVFVDENSAASTVINGCTFSDNIASVSGGAVYLDTPHFGNQISNTVFNGNKAEGAGADGGNGGALYIAASGPLDTVTFTGNTATNSGGAVYARSTEVPDGYIIGGTFAANSAGNQGGAIHEASIGAGSISGTKFEGNSAGANGGAIFINGANIASKFINITQSNFLQNTAKTHGGAVSLSCLLALGGFNIVHTNFNSNQADIGGAVSLENGCIVDLQTASFGDNKAKTNGGALSCEQGKQQTRAKIDGIGTTFSDNTADGKPQAVWTDDSCKGAFWDVCPCKKDCVLCPLACVTDKTEKTCECQGPEGDGWCGDGNSTDLTWLWITLGVVGGLLVIAIAAAGGFFAYRYHKQRTAYDTA